MLILFIDIHIHCQQMINKKQLILINGLENQLLKLIK